MKRHASLAVATCGLLPVLVHAQQASPPASQVIELPQVNVIAPTPLLGSGVDRDTVPAETNVLTSGDVVRTGIPDMLGALNDSIPGVTLGQGAGNPYQPNLSYHGFMASPLQGNTQGLAVYVNGVRFNQPFGDTVNWDLIPDVAIDRINVEGANPVYGLNALGGSIAVRLKDGFSYQGGELQLAGGSFGHIESNFQYGKRSGNVAAYIAGSVQDQDGWRDGQSSNLYNIHGDIGWRSDRAELHLGITAADTQLNGPGTVPVDLLSVNPKAEFTGPNLITNKYMLINLSGSYSISDTTSLDVVAYYQYLLQRVVNGNAPDFGSCGDGSGFLCTDPGTFLTGRNSAPISDFLQGGPYSQLDQQTTNTNGYGISAQVTNTDDIFGHRNHFVAGASFDGANTMFSANSSAGGLTPDDRSFIGPGVVIDQIDGSIAPVRVAATNESFGVFLTDTLNLTDRLALTASGRLNVIETDLHDQIGSALSGNHSYTHFNPGIGGTYRILPWLTAYASLATANRAPTPQELSCASAASPCSLANFFTGDPDLKQVVAHTIEAGLRGRFQPFDGANLDWDVSYFHTNVNDDILFVNSPIQGRAFFQNVGTTRRQGIDASARLSTGRWNIFANYSFTDATFQSGFMESSENNPAADANGNIQVSPGDRLPGIPSSVLKLGATYKITDKWIVGATGIAASGQYLFGDEANLTKKLPGYFVLNLNTSYQLTPHIQFFGLIQNALDAKYYTFGTFSPTSSIPITQAPGASNPRSYSLAAPVGGFGGVRVSF